MVRLRKPRPVIPETGYTASSRTLQPAAKSCGDCRWPGRCRADRLCWQAEKTAIAADKAKPAKVEWTRELVVDAIRRHVALTGSPPTNDGWATSTTTYPSATVVRRLFGSWGAALTAAGYSRGVYGAWSRIP